MSATYCPVTEFEMDAVLKAEKGWKKEYDDQFTKELVYTFSPPSRPFLQFKVYSSIKKNTSVSRGCGEDAIRFCCINLKTQKGVRKTGRINRVPNWEIRLQERMTAMIKDVFGVK